MQKEIRIQSQKMTIVVICLIGLCVWQSKFVITAIASNVYMNGTIIVAFVLSMALAFYKVASLKTDVTALHALQEMWDDVLERDRNPNADPLRRHYRAMKPGIVFQPPKILGHAYELVLDEIARTGRLSITVSSMSTLIHKIDAKLAEERSGLNYMSGLLVFMGLIGAFLGLLKMVGSIGGILGGLSSAGGGGGSNADAFNKLLTDLQAPLGGMATGFASSLFGLFGSLVVGLLARFVNQAATSIKHEFENWLANVVQIEKSIEDDKVETAPAMRAMLDPSFGQMISSGLDRSNRALLRSVDALGAMVKQQEHHGQSLHALSLHVEKVANRQSDLQAQVGLIQSLGTALQELRADVARVERSVDSRIAAGLGEIGRATTESVNAQIAMMEKMSRHQSDLIASVAKLVAQPDRPNPVAADNQKVIAEGFAQMTKVLEASNRAVAHGLMSIARQNATPPVVTHVDTGAATTELAQLIRKLDENMTASLMQVARSMEDAFVAYSGHLKPPPPDIDSDDVPLVPSEPVTSAVTKESEQDSVVFLQKFFDAARNAYRDPAQLSARTAAKV